MKRQIFFIFAAFAFCANAWAQYDSVAFAKTPDGKEWKAPCLAFKKSCYDFSVSPDRNLAAVKFGVITRNGSFKIDGELCMVDLQSGQPLWSRFIQLYDRSLASKAPVIRLTRHGLLLLRGSRTEMLDSRTQTLLWKEKLLPLFRNDSLDILMGYQSATSSKLKGLQLSTGRQLWEGKVPHKNNWGWNRMRVVNDTTVAVVADDIHFINPLTGRIRTHKAYTGYEDVGASVLLGLAGALGGVVGGAFVGSSSYYVPYVGSSIVSGLSSDILYRDGRYYVSDRDSLRCLDADARTLWARGLPPKMVGRADLFGTDGPLLMVNYAFGLRGGANMKTVGKPFIASFDAATGKTVCFNYLTAKKNRIVKSACSANAVYLMFDDALGRMGLRDSVVDVQPWNSKADGQLVAMLSDTIYTFRESDQTLTPLCVSDHRCVVMTDQEKLFVVDDRLKIVEDYAADHIYRVLCRWGDCALVNFNGRKGDNWIIRKSGEPLAHITVPLVSLRLMDDTLYLLSGTRLFCINVKNL